jgi:hypothetical protein
MAALMDKAANPRIGYLTVALRLTVDTITAIAALSS